VVDEVFFIASINGKRGVDKEHETGRPNANLRHVIDTQAFCSHHRRVVFLHGIDDAFVELMRGDTPLEILFYLDDHIEDLVDIAAGFCRDKEFWALFDKRDLFFEAADAVFHAKALIEIPFIEEEDKGLFLFFNHREDFLLFCRHTFLRIHDEEGNIGALESLLCAQMSKFFDRIFMFVPFSNASGVDEEKGFIVVGNRCVDGIARGASHWRDNDTL